MSARNDLLLVGKLPRIISRPIHGLLLQLIYFLAMTQVRLNLDQGVQKKETVFTRDQPTTAYAIATL